MTTWLDLDERNADDSTGVVTQPLSMLEVLRYRLILATLPPLNALGPKAPECR